MVNFHATFYIVESNMLKARQLMTAFLMGEDCPQCPENPGRNHWGWNCECITYDNTDTDYNWCDCEECQNWNEYGTESKQ